jgi:NAD(P)-dependent dehydrogenase (short-subunit alcohol dehydrogenase family)
MVGRLEGKVAIIMGAGSAPGAGTGTGKAMAILFAREGAKVLAVDRFAAAVAITKDIIIGEGGTCATYIADVTIAADVEGTIQYCLERFGVIDILVNNIGVGTVAGLIDTSEEEWDRVMSINVKSVFLSCKSALPHMVKRKQGAIVNVSSTMSIRVGIPLAVYAASKAAVNQLTRVVAMAHVRDGIRSNAVLPGVIDTPMANSMMMDHFGDLDTVRKERSKLSPTGIQGEPWDIAYAALYLASPEAKFVNGIELIVDGGQCQALPQGPQ